MKALSLWQPWASAWLSPIKLHETRGRRFNHRGGLLVHAAKRMVLEPLNPHFAERVAAHFGPDWPETLPTGALIGMVRITGCYRVEDVAPEADDRSAGDYSPGRSAILRAPEFTVFKKPIPWRGQQTAPFDVPMTLLMRVAGWSPLE